MARLNGYGVQLVPYWPYRFVRPDGADPHVAQVARVRPTRTH